MAKKLNTKVLVIVFIVFGIFAIIVAGLGFRILQRRNPDYCLAKANQALTAGDYETAERYFGRAVGVTKSDTGKIDRYFDLADFHLIQNEEHEPNWRKALGCWNGVLNIDPKHRVALEKLLDYFYTRADLGSGTLWKQVEEYSQKLLEVLKEGDENYFDVLRMYARSNLEIARLGSESYRQESLDEAIKDLNILVEKNPGDQELYFYLADAALVQRMIDESRGVRTNETEAQTKALHFLEQATVNGTDSSLAWARLLRFEIQTGDPNKLDTRRDEIQERIRSLPPSDELYLTLCIAYEQPGGLDREEEISRAIEAIREALKLNPTNVEYSLRLASLLYRKGNIFNQPSLIDEAIQVAETALNLPDCQNLTGPREQYSIQNRYRFFSFLGQIYVEKTLHARDEGKPETQIAPLLEKVRLYGNNILQILGTDETPQGQKWQGLITLAEGNRQRGLRILYQAFEQAKALDKPGQRSQVDSFLCYVLAKEMPESELPGLRREFLTYALFNVNSIAQSVPQVFLDYCQILIDTQSYSQAIRLIDDYEATYEPNSESRHIRLLATILSGQYDSARELLAAMPSATGESLEGWYALYQRQLSSLRSQLAAAQEADSTTTDSLKNEISRFNQSLLDTVMQLLKTDPARVDENEFLTLCRRQIAENRYQDISLLLDEYLRAFPNSQGALLLRRELQEPDPTAISQEQRFSYLKEILADIADPETTAVSLAEFCLSTGQQDLALDYFKKAYELNNQNTSAIRSYFELLLREKDFDTAASVLQHARSLNADGCEGNLLSAQLAIAQEELPLALRRLEECLALRPLLPQAYVLKSRVYMLQDQMNESVEAIQTAVQMNPIDPAILLQWASMLNERNRRLGTKVTPEQQQEALTSIRIARAFNPRNLDLQSYYAELISQQNPLEGLALRQRLFEIQPVPKLGILLGNMAIRIAQQTKDKDDREALVEMAGDAFRKAYELDPNDESAVNAYAEHLRRIGKNEQAVPLLESNPKFLYNFYLRDGQFDKAVELLKPLHEKNPEDYETLKALVLAYQGLGDQDAMQQYLHLMLEKAQTAQEELWVIQKYLETGLAEVIQKDLLSFEQRYPDEPSILLLRAWYEMNSGQLQNALDLTNRFLETNTQHNGAWRLRGRIYRLMGKYREAADALQRSKEINPLPEVQMELANVYLENNQVDAAVGELRAAMELPQAPVSIRMMLERVLLQKNRLSDLRRFYEETLAKYPDNAYWMFRAGQFALDQKEYSTACEILEKAWLRSRENGPGDIKILDLYLESLFQSQQYEKLLSTASNLVDGPFAPVVYAQLGQTQIKLGNSRQAVENFKKALNRSQTNEMLLDGVLTNMLSNVGQEPAVEWANDQIRKDPESLAGRYILMKLAQQSGQYKQALAYLNENMEALGPDHPARIRFLLQKAEILTAAYATTLDASLLDELISTFEAILEKQPNNFNIMNNLAYLLLDTNQQIDRALEYSLEASLRVPTNATFKDTYALALYKNGQYEDAMKAILRSIQLSEAANEPVPWEVYKHQAMILEKLQKTEEALDAFRKALSQPDTPETEKDGLQQSIKRLSDLITNR